MNIILLIGVALIILSVIFHKSKMNKIRKAEKSDQEETKRDVGEKVMSPQRKFHEEEKKRWEDDYWKNQVKRKK
jgi:hypothetical protein